MHVVFTLYILLTRSISVHTVSIVFYGEVTQCTLNSLNELFWHAISNFFLPEKDREVHSLNVLYFCSFFSISE